MILLTNLHKLVEIKRAFHVAEADVVTEAAVDGAKRAVLRAEQDAAGSRTRNVRSSHSTPACERS